MGFRSRLAAIFSRKQVVQGSILAQLGSATWTTWNYEAFAREGFGANPYAYRGITVIADAVAGVRWLGYRVEGDEFVELDSGDKLMRLIRRPNEQQGTSEWLRELSLHMYIGGEAFIRGLSPQTRKGPPVMLYNLRPDLVGVTPGTTKASPVAGYTYQGPQGREDIPPEEVCHLKFVNPTDDVRGLSPLSACARSLDVNNEGRKLNKALLEHGGVPGLIVKMSGGTEADAEKLLARLNSRSGASQAGRNMVLPKTQDVDKASWSPADMQWSAGLQVSAREVAVTLGVPSGLLGDMAEKTYAKLRAERASLYQETVLPFMDHIRDALNRWLSPQFGPNLFLAYDKDNIEALSEEQSSMWDRVIKAFQAGLLTLDQALEELGYEGVGGEMGASRFTQQPMLALESTAAPGTPAEEE